MSEQPVAFVGAYADWKLIKTRSVIQIVLEVPVEQADRAYQVLGGMPAPGAETWCAIARLVNDSSKPSIAVDPERMQPDRPHSPRKPVAADKKLAQQAGICCNDPVFWRFLTEVYTYAPASEPDAAEAVRDLCGIGSRKELIPGSPAASQWMKIESRFTAWKLAA